MTTQKQWSPVEVEVLLRCYYSGEPNNGIPTGRAYKEARDMWEQNECITLLDTDIGRPDARYNTTEKGKTLVMMWCTAPMPVASWRDPRFS